MDRKKFIKNCSLACLGGTSLIVVVESCASPNYFAQTVVANNKITIRKTEFSQVKKDKIIQRKYVLVRTEQFNYPICIYRLHEDNYSALLMQCSHRGCELHPHSDFLSCPCHGSEFTNRGIVQNPPAEHNLHTFKTTTDDENVYILL